MKYVRRFALVLFVIVGLIGIVSYASSSTYNLNLGNDYEVIKTGKKIR